MPVFLNSLSIGGPDYKLLSGRIHAQNIPYRPAYPAGSAGYITLEHNAMKELQNPPKGDNRYRVHRSVKCYLLEMLCGTGFYTLYITNSIERVVYKFTNGTQKIQYKNNFYNLQSAEIMAELVNQHLADKGAVNLSGKSLYAYHKDKAFDSYPFIDITGSDDRERYPKIRGKWLDSDAFKKASQPFIAADRLQRRLNSAH